MASTESAVDHHKIFVEKLNVASIALVKLLSQKNLAYGNSYETVPAIIKLLYPDGVSVDQLDNMLLIVRILDKLKRISVNNDPFGEDPWQDIAGYALMRIATRI